MSQQNTTDLSQVIAEEFGANATYVEGLLERFRSNPELVDDSWRSYFSELIGDGNGAATAVSSAAAARCARAGNPNRRRSCARYRNPTAKWFRCAARH